MIPFWRFFLMLLAASIGWPVWRIGIWWRGRAVGERLRILVVPATNRIGDMVCATPVLRAIKERYPNAYVAVLVSKGKKAWQIFQHNPRVSEIIFYETPRFTAHIRRQRFDASFALTNYALPSVVAFLGLIPLRVKTVIPDPSLAETLTDFLNTYQCLYRHHTYLPRHYLRLLEVIGIADAPEVQEVFSVPEIDEKVKAILAQAKFTADDFIVGLSVTAGNKIKEWGIENFARLADALIGEYQAKILLIGAERDQSTLAQVEEMMHVRGCTFGATTFLVEGLPSWIRQTKLFISVDTGPLYIAHALGVPVVDIVGPVDPREQPPQDGRSIIVAPSHIEPSSFVLHRPGAQDHAHAIKAITVEMVMAAAQELFRRGVLLRSRGAMAD